LEEQEVRKFAPTWGGTSVALYAGVSVLVALWLHSSYSTCMMQLNVATGYLMPVTEGISVGVGLALATFALVWLTLSVQIRAEPTRMEAFYRAVVATVFTLLPFLAVILLTSWIPMWYSSGLVYCVVIPALAISVSAFWNHRFRGSAYTTPKALERDYTKLLQTISTVGWLIAFLAATTVFGFFNNLLLARIDKELWGTEPAVWLISVHAIGCVVLLGGMAVVMLAPLANRLRKIETALEESGKVREPDW